MGVDAQLPREHSLERIASRAGQITDPVARLRFLQGAMSEVAEPAGHALPSRTVTWPFLAWFRVWARPLRRRLQPHARRLEPLLRHRTAWAGALALGLLLIVPSQTMVPSNTGAPAARLATPAAGSVKPPTPATARIPSPSDVWLVETRDGIEIYSNGLQIETRETEANTPRRYRPYRLRSDLALAADERTRPAGVVYHTTESHLAAFAPENNRQLVRAGAGLLSWVRQNRSYHYVIDRFGRIWRVVPESDVAHHAGNSTWADADWAYLNLNHSFLGVAFEAQTNAGDQTTAVTPAQVHAARVLTEMLRAKYRWVAGNCVTHAQVSVNPSNMMVGYHTDWASHFPFAELGLDDNYALPLASLSVFGFRYDAAFLQRTGAARWQGLARADRQLWEEAQRQRTTVAALRSRLQERYKRLYAALKSASPHEEKNNGS